MSGPEDGLAKPGPLSPSVPQLQENCPPLAALSIVGSPRRPVRHPLCSSLQMPPGVGFTSPLSVSPGLLAGVLLPQAPPCAVWSAVNPPYVGTALPQIQLITASPGHRPRRDPAYVSEPEQVSRRLSLPGASTGTPEISRTAHSCLRLFTTHGQRVQALSASTTRCPPFWLLFGNRITE